MGINEDEGVCYRQPTTLAERAQIASDFVKQTEYEIPVVIDTMDDAVEAAFAGWPERLYVIDAGLVAYKGGVGPMDFDPDELETWLAGRLE
jgi:type I thyroxine 5'-deiodinase